MPTSLRLNWSQIPFKTHLLAIYNEMGGSGDLDSAVATEFQTQWDAIVDKLSPLMVITNTGARLENSIIFKPELPLAILISPAQ